LPNNFEILEKGDYVICAVSEKKIYLDQLVYWNVELQEPYFSYKEAFLKNESLLKNK
jgi:hypothetical protein